MATVTPAKAARSVLNHPNFKMRLGDKLDKGDKLALEALNQRLEPIIKASEEKRQKIEASRFNKSLGLPEHWDGNWLSGIDAIKAFRAANNPTAIDSSKLTIPQLGSYKTEFGKANPDNTLAKPYNPSVDASDYEARVPWLGAVSSIAGNLLMNKKLNLPEYQYDEYNPESVTPNLVNYGRDREQILSDRDLNNNMIINSARNTGSANAAMENIIAGATGTQRVAGQLYGKSLQDEQNMNAGIRNQASQFNAAQRERANQINSQNKMYANQISSQNKMINAERSDARTAGILDSITGYGKDLMAADQYNTMLKIATPDNFKLIATNDKPWKRFLGVNSGSKKILTKSQKLELGGFISIPKSKSQPISFRKK